MAVFSKASRLFRRPSPRLVQARGFSITSRGKPIDRNDIFKYTNGRFLVQQKQQSESRYVKFDIDRLCQIAASAGKTKSSITAIEKLEGGFSKALLLKKEDGTELVAKIPCPNAGPGRLVTASEVAVLDYVRKHTTIPVPSVHTWDSDPANPVGAEYIIMEKAPGVQLYEVWDDLDDSARLQLLEQLVKYESELASIEFPATGSLYLRRDTAGMKANFVDLPSLIDPKSSYCVGLSCDRTWWPRPESLDENRYAGPWKTFADFGEALVDRETARVAQDAKAATNSDGPPHGTIEEQRAVLQMARRTMAALKSHCPLTQFARPVLYHADLHMGNIYVAKENPSEIVSIIDWQHTQIAPLFLQARWPRFLEPNTDYPTGPVEIALPEDFDTLDDDDKLIAQLEHRAAKATKTYEMRTYFDNNVAYEAMIDLPRVYREFFVRTGETFAEGCIPVRECLIELSRSLKKDGEQQQRLLPDSQPKVDTPTLDLPSFSESQLSAHDEEFEKYEAWHAVVHFARKYLGTDFEGWVSPELDFEEKLRQNRELFELYVTQMAEGKSEEEVRRMWPFAEAL